MKTNNDFFEKLKKILNKKVPLLKVESDTIKHENGRVDIIIKPTVLKVKGK